MSQEKDLTMEKYLDEKWDSAHALRKLRVAGAPEVGIFWVVDGKILPMGASLSEAESYGDFKNFKRDHCKEWKTYQRAGIVPMDSEYEEYPRGRVNYNTKTRLFTLRADKCILKDHKLVQKLLADFNLPTNTTVESDPHYKCPKCGG
jgi:hypothetical protein